MACGNGKQKWKGCNRRVGMKILHLFHKVIRQLVNGVASLVRTAGLAHPNLKNRTSMIEDFGKTSLRY